MRHLYPDLDYFQNIPKVKVEKEYSEDISKGQYQFYIDFSDDKYIDHLNLCKINIDSSTDPLK